MAFNLWTQTNFSRGELSPYMYARADVQQYFDGLKTAQNVQTYPTGGAGKRFGTLYMATLNAAITNLNQIYFQTFQYLDECVYQLVFYPSNIDIYLEGVLIANVSTSLNQSNVYNLDNTVLSTNFRVAGAGFKPMDLTRSSDAGNVIASVSGGVWNLTSSVTAGQILPVQIGTNGTLPTTIPQINAGVTYFALNLSTSTMALYPTSLDAKYGTNPFTLVDDGSGTNTLYTFNTWNFGEVGFKNLPVFDFLQNYDSVVFTPSATTGDSSRGSLSLFP